MTDRTVGRIFTLFVLCVAALIARQAYVQLVAGPSIAARINNPRHALLDADRGRILATDGTVLAQTVKGKRTYPMGPAIAQAVGYASTRYGTSGLERAYDAALTPPAVGADPLAQLQNIIAAFAGKQDRARGADIVTTIVPAVQRELYDDLAAHPRAAGVVLDPRSGAVLALASVPSFDANDLDAIFPSLAKDPSSPLLDRALDGLYPPGSTFKVFTASAALDSGSETMQSTFYDPGYLHVGTFTFHNDEDESTGTADITRAFALSSNVDFAQIAMRLGTQRFYDYLRRWDIGGSLEFQIPASRARIPPAQGLSEGELAQMGFGEGALLMTPLQMALIAATIADGGNEPRPYVVRQVVRAGEASSAFDRGVLSTPISAETAANVKKMMIAVVTYGTGTSAQLPGTTVAGKTGTATNPLGRAHSWFICFAPADDPRVAVAIVVENAGYGAAVAAPIARDILRTTLASVSR